MRSRSSAASVQPGQEIDGSSAASVQPGQEIDGGHRNLRGEIRGETAGGQMILWEWGSVDKRTPDQGEKTLAKSEMRMMFG
ncbi:MAG: hypothetical protein ACYS9H_01190, partial [Planctomycetota bacterium]